MRRDEGRSSLLSWFWTIASGCVLIVGGFGVGLVLGVASDEPELVVAHLAGRTRSVPWHVEDPDSAADQEGVAQAALPDVAAAPPADASARPRPAAGADPEQAPVAHFDPPAGFSVQVGAFASSEAADEVADGLRAKGYPSYVAPSGGARDGRWRVRVGPYDARDEAEGTAIRLKRDEKLPTWVLNETN